MGNLIRREFAEGDVAVVLTTGNGSRFPHSYDIGERVVILGPEEKENAWENGEKLLDAWVTVYKCCNNPDRLGQFGFTQWVPQEELQPTGECLDKEDMEEIARSVL